MSLHAVEQALSLTERSGGRLTLLHVLEGFPYETVYSGSRAFRLVRDYRARVQRVHRELRALVPPAALNWCDVDTAAVSGESHEVILATAVDRRADLIVMGLPRKPCLEQLLAGSTVKRVLRRATCPVLLVPGPSAVSAPVGDLAQRIQAEYAEMPGLSVTLAQAQRLWAADPRTCETVFERLVARGVVRMTTTGRFIRA